MNIAVVAAALALAPVHVTLSAPGHTPRVNVHWNYAVHAVQDGRPVAAHLTELMVDPIGGKHPITFGTGNKPIKNWPFKGTFRDFILWPASARGVPLTLRVIVTVGKVKRTIDYHVTPRG